MQTQETLSPAEPIFLEEQQFRQPLVWTAFFATCFLVFFGVGLTFYIQFLQSRSGTSPPPDRSAIWMTGLLTIALNIGLLALFWFTVLKTEVRAGILRVRFVPFQSRWQEIPMLSVRSFEAVEYNALREYGGWGIRYGRKGKALNVSGNRGVQLEFSDGKRLLIGSQRPDELAAALARARNSSP